MSSKPKVKPDDSPMVEVMFTQKVVVPVTTFNYYRFVDGDTEERLLVASDASIALANLQLAAEDDYDGDVSTAIIDFDVIFDECEWEISIEDVK